MNANELADKLENKDRLWSVDEKLMVKNAANIFLLIFYFFSQRA